MLFQASGGRGAAGNADDGLTGTDPRLATLAAAGQGDPEAIATLYRELQPRLLRVLRAECGDAADDVASQTWLEVVGVLRRFQGDFDGFRALLFTIARRRVADHRRTRRRRPATPTEPTALNDRVEAVDDPERTALDGMSGQSAVQRIIDLLPPDQAEVVLLRIVADLPVEQVAKLLGRAPGTIRVQQHRALKRLAAVLGGNDRATSGDMGPR
jgi:RNA polymerase sigma-70 factor (ECF subfamily)